jgi:hypothetical protein
VRPRGRGRHRYQAWKDWTWQKLLTPPPTESLAMVVLQVSRPDARHGLDLSDRLGDAAEPPKPCRRP